MLPKFIDQILNIDCLQGMKKIKDKSVDLVLADPPYGISREINTKGKRIGNSGILDFNFGKWDILDETWIDLAIQKTKGWFISFSSKRDIGLYWEHLEKNKFIAIDSLVWVKPDPLPFNAKSRFVNSWEAIIVGKRAGATWNSNYFTDVLNFHSPKNKDRVHPTQKPLGLIIKLIELTTNVGGVVLDPFMGSGTTAVAAKILNRHFIGFEINKKYYNISLKRLNSQKLIRSKNLLEF